METENTKLDEHLHSIAVKVAVLFLTALVLNIIATAISDRILNSSDTLLIAYPEKIPVILAGLLNFSCALAMIFIPLLLFPILKPSGPNFAIGYVVFRFLEGILVIFMVIKTLIFIPLSKAYLQAGTKLSSCFSALADSVHSELHWTTIIYIFIFTLGALMFYSLLFRSELLPRWLSAWGTLSAVLLSIGAFMAMFNLGIFREMPLMKAMAYFAPPIVLNEFVLSLWLIFRGFNPKAIPPHLQSN